MTLTELKKLNIATLSNILGFNIVRYKRKHNGKLLSSYGLELDEHIIADFGNTRTALYESIAGCFTAKELKNKDKLITSEQVVDYLCFNSVTVDDRNEAEIDMFYTKTGYFCISDYMRDCYATS